MAALAEIAGCFAIWSVVRGGRSAWWLAPGIASLVVFAWVLTRVDLPAAGRTYAAYGGIYIVASLGWLMAVERVAPTRTDVAGGVLALAGCLVILAGTRGS